MLQEADAEEVEQWASFDTFDFAALESHHRPADLIILKEQDVPNECSTNDGMSVTTESNSRSDEFSFSQNDFRDLECMDRIRAMENEHEVLNSSLMTLTTHFAQVQFRLKQIASTEDAATKEKLMKDLEMFASEGCPDVRAMIKEPSDCEDSSEQPADYQTEARETRALIQRLQKQLTDVEKWAYSSGQADMPSMEVLEKQKMILDALQEKVKLGINGYDNLPPEELRAKVDEAIESIILPYQKKVIDQERTVTNLQTFVEDLERYIELHQVEPEGKAGAAEPLLSESSRSNEGVREQPDRKIHRQSSLTNLLQRTYHVMQFIPIMNLCVRQPRFRQNAMKTTVKGNHWGDIRAILELAISGTLEIAQRRQAELRKPVLTPNHNAKVDDRKSASESLTRVVRKKLAPALWDLMKHGLLHVSNDRSLVPSLMCTSRRGDVVEMNPWDFVLQYYEYKKGNQFNHTAARKLADSFQLSAVGDIKITPVELFLGAVGEIVDSHHKFKQSPLTLFKAFVCAALNKKCLSTWLRQMYCTKVMTDEYYTPWSYARRTHFDDTCYAMERLTPYDFNLQVDIAVKPFASLNEAF